MSPENEETSTGNRYLEGCSWQSFAPFPDQLHGVMTVKFWDTHAKKLLKEARFYVDADDTIDAWISSHLTFKKGCWPVGIMQLHDWMWKMKFIDVPDGKPTVVNGGTRDPKIGGVVNIRGEFHNYEKDTRWFLPLANIAKTHLMDELRLFYKDHPHLMASGQRIEMLKDEVREKNRASMQAMISTQLRNRQLLKAPTKTIKIYIDETGDIGFKDQLHKTYIIVAAMVPEEKRAKVEEELKGLLIKHWGTHPPTEIHMVKVPDAKKDALRNDLAKIVLDNEIEMIAYFYQKEYFIKHLLRCHAEARWMEECPLDIIWEDLIHDKSFGLQSNTLATSVEFLVSDFAVDFLTGGIAAEMIHDRKHRPWMNEALEKGFAQGIESAKEIASSVFGISAKPQTKFSLSDSQEQPCLWIADWVASELKGWCEHGDPSNAFERIRDCISYIGFTEQGVKCSGDSLGSVAKKEFLDIPRLLRK